MNITRYDLCYGDFVRYDGITAKVIGVMVDGYEYILVNEEGYPYNVFHIDDIEPIPITEELLVKIGFVYNEFGDLLMWDGEDGNIHVTKDKKHCYIGYNGKQILTSNIGYVHELQHLMRLCKIEKEIKI